MGELVPLTPQEVREIKLPWLPWRRQAAIAQYAADLILPGVEGLDRTPKTKLGLERLSRNRHYHDDYVKFHGRISELEEIYGEGSNEALTIATRELFGAEDPAEQPTLFDKEI